MKNASIFKPATYSVPNRFIPWVQEFSAATCELFGPHGMQNRAAEPLAARVESPDELLGPLLGSWELQTNATLPPYSDEYAELEQYLYARRRVNRNREVISDLAEKNRQLEGKRGMEPGWLADDELTHDWLRRVEQYRSECDASDRRRLLSDPAAGEGAS